MMSYLGNHHWDSGRGNNGWSMKRGEKRDIGSDGSDGKECFWAPLLRVCGAVAGRLRVFNKQPVET